MKSRMTLLAVVFAWLAGTGYTATFQYAVNGTPFDTDGLTHYVAPGTVTIDLTCTSVDQYPVYEGEIICLMRDASLTDTYFEPANLPGQWWIEDLGWFPSYELGEMTDSDGELIEGWFMFLWGDHYYFPDMSEGHMWTLSFQMPAMSKVIFFNMAVEEEFAIATIPEPASAVIMLLGTVWMTCKRKG